ncbi:MAG: four-carbon acid sugar kinase family protein [Haloechinothrix sp.]
MTPVRRLVMDDDPTGTQTVAGVCVILEPSTAAFRSWLRSGERAAYVLTNSRALPESEAVTLVRSIARQARQAAIETGCHVEFLLRGDSTLRGHVFAEMDAFATPDSVSLFVPAFPEAGRVTIDGVHYLEQDGQRVPVAATEFAADPVFGYLSHRLVDWVAEVGDGRQAQSVQLAQVRAGPAAVRDALLEAPAGSVVLPDVENRSDIEVVVRGLAEAQQRGRAVVVRSAATFAAAWAGLSGEQLEPGDAQLRGSGPVVLVCGSHTAAATRQLDEVRARWSRPPVVLRTREVLAPKAAVAVAQAAKRLTEELETSGFAVLATERERRAYHAGLDVGAEVMKALTATMAAVRDLVDAVIAKGGITSAQVATDGLGARSAWVVGQLQVGVPLWRLACDDGRQLRYAVVPGNVGDQHTLTTVARLLGAPLPPKESR